MNILMTCQALAQRLIARSRTVRSEEGASLIEYGLLIALIAIVCVVAIEFLGNSTSSSFSRAGSMLSR